MTDFLEIVNDVLIELREEEVSSVTDEDYSKLVGRFVNRALRQVANAHDWSDTLTEFTIQTTDDNPYYPLTGAGKYVKIYYVVNLDTQHEPKRTTRRWAKLQIARDIANNTTPSYWFNSGTDGTDAQIGFYPPPDGQHNFFVEAFVKPAELVEDTDEVVLPKQPIVDLALAFAARERGEVGGTTAAEYFELAKRSLSDEIDIDRARNDEETDWYVD